MNGNERIEFLEAIINSYAIDEEKGIYKEYAPPKTEDIPYAYLFSQFGLTGMLYFAVKSGLEVKKQYKSALDGLNYYRSMPYDDDSIKYHSERGENYNGGHATCFFDDNIWVARNNLFAYEIFGKKEYLLEAQRITRYIYKGWDEELGGLVWNELGLTPKGSEQDLERGLSANACCIIVNSLLYQITGEESYLNWAKKFYEFCKRMQDPVTKVYYNGVHTIVEDAKKHSGAINKDLYAYNSGSMILADILLHEITNDDSYLQDAIACAHATHKAFLVDKEDNLKYYDGFNWFTAILIEGYQELVEYPKTPDSDRELVLSYMDMVKEGLTYSFDNFKSEYGLLPHDYTIGWRDNEPEETKVFDRLFLTQTGLAEMVFLTADK